MTALLFPLIIIGVAIEAAVILYLINKIRKHNTPRRVVYEEPMPWKQEEWK